MTTAVDWDAVFAAATPTRNRCTCAAERRRWPDYCGWCEHRIDLAESVREHGTGEEL